MLRQVRHRHEQRGARQVGVPEIVLADMGWLPRHLQTLVRQLGGGFFHLAHHQLQLACVLGRLFHNRCQIASLYQVDSVVIRVEQLRRAYASPSGECTAGQSHGVVGVRVRCAGRVGDAEVPASDACGGTDEQSLLCFREWEGSMARLEGHRPARQLHPQPKTPRATPSNSSAQRVVPHLGQ